MLNKQCLLYFIFLKRFLWGGGLLKYNPEKALISFHLPKCGGTSLTKILKGWFGERFYTHYYREGAMPKRHVLPAGSCIHGHFNPKRNVGVMEYYPDETQYITFLRDPLDSVKSLYYFNVERESKGLSIGGRELGGFVKEFPDVDSFIRVAQFQALSHFPFSIDEDNYKEILDNFVFIGVMEHYQRSIELLANVLGKPVPRGVPHVNKGKKKEEPSRETEEVFKKRNKVSCLLYDEVVSSLE